jgi:hypothetical protein
MLTITAIPNNGKITAATSTPGATTTTPITNDKLADDPKLGIQDQREVLTAVELGKILRIHPVTVRLKAAAGEIPGRQLGCAQHGRVLTGASPVVSWSQ